MSDASGDVGAAIFYGVLLLVLYFGGRLWVRFAFRPRSVNGLIELENGRSYVYTIGDDLEWGYASVELGHLRAIDISLPKEMPHIYLDSLVGGGMASTFTIDPKQRLQLEGNFNEYFQVFVPKRYEVEALSILSPDVMETMVGVAGEYDFEIYGSHLRVISRRRLFKYPERQREVIAVATKLLAEVDHRLQSWSHEDSMAAREQSLDIFPTHGIRLLGRFYKVDVIFLEFVWVLLASAFGVPAWMVRDQSAVMALTLLSIGIAIFIILSALTIIGAQQSRFRSRGKAL